MEANQINEFYELLNALREGIITDTQFDQLDTWLSADEYACRVYVDYIKMWSELESFQMATSSGYDPLLSCFDQSEEAAILDLRLWEALAENERTAPATRIEKPVEKKPTEPIAVRKIKIERKPAKFPLFTAILSAAAVLLFVLVIQFPVPPTVATLTDSIDAEWGSRGNKLFDGDLLREGETLTLLKGLAEITFDNGAIVVLESPATIEIESSGSMFVSYGKVGAVVSEYAMGFTVNTPSASIVDLGTEFGVRVESSGQCSLHMFEGKANLIAGPIGQKRVSQVVVENEARSVSASNGQIRTIPLARTNFVRRFDSTNGSVWRGQDINLADIVGGGSGFGDNRYGYAVESWTGRISSRAIFEIQKAEARFIPVPDSAFIDGVFVPNGEKEVVVSTQNHLFTECPDTNSQVYSPIVNVPRDWGSRSETVKPRFGGEIYGGAANPAICIESNQGITFDLEAVRRTLPENTMIEQLQAVCGISSEVITRWNMNVKASIWVLVDGEVRFKAVGIDVLSGKHSVKVDLKPTDRFLTLVATDGGDEKGKGAANNHDSCFFGRPVLVLGTAE